MESFTAPACAITGSSKAHRLYWKHSIVVAPFMALRQIINHCVRVQPLLSTKITIWCIKDANRQGHRHKQARDNKISISRRKNKKKICVFDINKSLNWELIFEFMNNKNDIYFWLNLWSRNLIFVCLRGWTQISDRIFARQ